MIMCFVIGAIMIASVAIFGGMSAVEFNRDINKATKTIPVELPSDISNVKRVAVESNGAISREFISSSETKVEVDYLDHKTNGVPVVKSMVEGDTLKVEIAGDHGVYCGTLPIILMRDCPSVVSVRVQGPFHSVERYGAGSILVE